MGICIHGEDLLFIFALRFAVRALLGHCHSDFAVSSSKLLKYLTKSLFANMKLHLERREENIRGFLQGRTNYIQFFCDFSKIHKKNLKKLADFFKFRSIFMLTICSQT